MSELQKSEGEILNIAAYKFVPLTDLEQRRETWLPECRRLGLKGTILLSPEGINMFLAGPMDVLRAWIESVRLDPLFQDLVVKESFSEEIPFNRMLVKIKEEIIAFGIEGIEPFRETSPKLPPQELKAWLDEGRDVLLLDVRNDFEVEVGTFEHAVPAGVDHFRQFEAAVDRLPEEAREKPIVMFCTGGIRCEKAGPLMERKGFQKIYQLDGGILRYFEEVGGDHYQGGCFVFDDRVALDPDLQANGMALCYACQAVLQPHELDDPRYVCGESCPRCYRTASERMNKVIVERHAAIEELARSLPGSEPHEQCRPLRIAERYDGWVLLDVLCDQFPQIPKTDWEEIISQGRITEGSIPVRAARRVRMGEQFYHRTPEFIEPDVDASIRILWEDDEIVVVDKPAPLPVHPSGRFNHNTLIGLMNRVYEPQVLRAAHRLDANTSGIIVLCRRRSIASELQQQFETQQVKKRYLALVHGHPDEDAFTRSVPIGIQAGAGRIRIPDVSGADATTEFRVLERRSNGTAIVEAIPITGRTNQIRVHLWEFGFPIVGDPLYLRDNRLGTNRTLGLDEPRMWLHAESLTFQHPQSAEPLTFQAPIEIDGC